MRPAAATIPGMSEPTSPQPSPVRQLRLVVETEDFDAALAFYRDVLGLPEKEAYEGADDARVLSRPRDGRASVPRRDLRGTRRYAGGAPPA